MFVSAVIHLISLVSQGMALILGTPMFWLMFWLLAVALAMCTLFTLQMRFRIKIETSGNPAQVTDVTALFYWRVLFGRARSRLM